MTANAQPSSAPAPPAPAEKSRLFPDDAQFWFETQRAFGAAEYGGALFGEVLATSVRIEAGDYDSWYEAWNDTADRVAREAADQLSRGRRGQRSRRIPSGLQLLSDVGVLLARTP